MLVFIRIRTSKIATHKCVTDTDNSTINIRTNSVTNINIEPTRVNSINLTSATTSIVIVTTHAIITMNNTMTCNSRITITVRGTVTITIVMSTPTSSIAYINCGTVRDITITQTITRMGVRNVAITVIITIIVNTRGSRSNITNTIKTNANITNTTTCTSTIVEHNTQYMCSRFTNYDLRIAIC